MYHVVTHIQASQCYKKLALNGNKFAELVENVKQMLVRKFKKPPLPLK
jgi:hypothetical protein